ncbi:MAG: hypothetical protein QM723_16245 [Myxococcaceae bacterium]
MRKSVLIVAALLCFSAGGLLGKLGVAPFDEPPAPRPTDRRVLLTAYPSRVSGTSSPMEVGWFINAHTQELRGCWRRLQPVEMMIVQAQLQLLVGDDGTVSAKVTNSSQNPRIDRCLLQVVRRWELRHGLSDTSIDLSMTAVFNAPPGMPNSERI